MPKFVKFNCTACLSMATIGFETTVHGDVGLVPFATDVGWLATYCCTVDGKFSLRINFL